LIRRGTEGVVELGANFNAHIFTTVASYALESNNDVKVSACIAQLIFHFPRLDKEGDRGGG
jgi:hypothetical protein